MAKLALGLLILAVALKALKEPWVGIVAYYLLALLGPQYIWWWNFEGLRVSLVVAAFTLAGVAMKVLGGSPLAPLKSNVNLYLLLLWCFTVLSYLAGPFVDHVVRGRIPEQLFWSTNNIFLFYFCAAATINDRGKLRHLTLVLVLSTVYLIYWANLQYFSSNWCQFSLGRLMGPYSMDGGSIYKDQNAFAMAFVCGVPFVYYQALTVSRTWVRLVFWATIPFGWHAVFLTGSRGGILGLATVTLLMTMKSRRKLLTVPLLLLFIIAYQWQAGSIMKQRSQTIAEYQGEAAAETRLVAWKGGWEMIKAHPLTGVGLGTFAVALPSFVESKSMVAHNTLVHYAAECGIGAGLCYLLVACSFLINSRSIARYCDKTGDRELASHNDASIVSFLGLMVCSIFLSLTTYEIFFYLLVIGNAMRVIVAGAGERGESTLPAREGVPCAVTTHS